MTYEEKYMKSKTLNELESEIKMDIVYALRTNSDRIKHINNAGIKVAKLNFNKEII